MSYKSWKGEVRKQINRKQSEAIEIREQFTYELGFRDWAYMAVLIIVCLAYAYYYGQFQTMFIGAISSLTIYLMGLLVQSRKNVEGPRQPIHYLEYPNEIRKARANVFVYTTFLRSLCCGSAYEEERESWLEALRFACRRNRPPEIKFSFLDPDHDNPIAKEAVRIRQRDLNEWSAKPGGYPIDVGKMIKENLWTLYCLCRYEGFMKINVCKYSRTPILSILQVDAVYSIAPYEIQPLHQTRRFNAHEDSSLGKFIQRITNDIKSDVCSAAGDVNALGWFDEVLLNFQIPNSQPPKSVEKAFPYVVAPDPKVPGQNMAYAAWIDHHNSGEYYEDCKLNGEILLFFVSGCSKERRFNQQVVNDEAIWSGPAYTNLKRGFVDKYGVDVGIDRFLPIGKPCF